MKNQQKFRMKTNLFFLGAVAYTQRVATALLLLTLLDCLPASAQIPSANPRDPWVHIGTEQVDSDVKTVLTNYPPGAAEVALREIRDGGPDAIDAVPYLSTVLLDTNRIPLQRRLAAEALGNLAPYSDKALNSLVAALGTADDTVAAQAAISIGRQKEVGQSAIAALGACVDKETTGGITRREAVRTLGNLAQFTENSLPSLARTIQRHRLNALETEVAIEAVTKFGPRAYTVIPVLAALSGDDSLRDSVRVAAVNSLQNIAGSLGKQSHFLKTTQLISAWWRLRGAEQALLSANADLQGTTKRSIDQSITELRAEAKRRGLLVAGQFGAVLGVLSLVSLVLVLFFPERAYWLNELVCQITTGTELTVPLVGWKIQIPELRIGKLLQYIFILGIFVKLASRFNWRNRGWKKNQNSNEVITYSI